MVSGEPMRPTGGAAWPFGVSFQAWYSSHRFTVPGIDRAVRVVEDQRELEERPAVGAALRLLVGVGDT